MGIDSEDFPYFSRTESLRLLLDAFIVTDEEDELLSSIPRIRRENISLVQCRSNSFFQWETILGEEPAGSLLCGFAFAFDRHAKSFALSLTHILRADLREFLFHCCSNSSQIYLIHDKF